MPIEMTVKTTYIISALLFLLAAVFSLGYHHFDEHFQILEFAALKLGMTEASNLPWEYHKQMRPSIQPAMVVLIHSFFGALGIDNPFTISTFLRVLSAIISFISVHLLYRAYRREIEDMVLRKWFLFLSFLLWFAVYNNVRFSSENWSGTIFLIAFALFYLKQSPNKWYYLLLGTLFGLSFLFRYQVGLLIGGLMLWLIFVKKETIVNLAFLTSGIVIMFGVGVLIDRWFYGEWLVTAWRYFEQTLLLDLDRVSRFGTSPWWYYFEKTFIKAIPPFSIVYLLSVIIVFVFRRKDILTWILLPFLLTHIFIGHKELRFLFPVIGLLPIFIVKATEIVQSRWNYSFRNNTVSKIFIRGFWITNILFLVFIVFKPASHQIGLYRAVHAQYPDPITLNYMGNNPYYRILDIYYYKRQSLQIKKLNSIEELSFNSDGLCLFATQNPKELDDVKYRHSLVYTTFPEWIRNFNINNWIERTKFWYVYELDTST